LSDNYVYKKMTIIKMVIFYKQIRLFCLTKIFIIKIKKFKNMFFQKNKNKISILAIVALFFSLNMSAQVI
jgi:hypothetical protein